MYCDRLTIDSHNMQPTSKMTNKPVFSQAYLRDIGPIWLQYAFSTDFFFGVEVGAGPKALVWSQTPLFQYVVTLDLVKSTRSMWLEEW